LIEDQGSKGKEGFLSTFKGNYGGLSNFSEVQRDSSFGYSKEEFKVKEFQRLHGSLSFKDLNFQFQEHLKIGGVVVA
jgi:hypothetical protein